MKRGAVRITAIIATLVVACALAQAQKRVYWRTVQHPGNLTVLYVAEERLDVVGFDSDGNPQYWYTPGGRIMMRTGPNSPAGRGGNPMYEGDEDKLILGRPGLMLDPATWQTKFIIAVDPNDPDNAQLIDVFDEAVNQSEDTDPNKLTSYWSTGAIVGARSVIMQGRYALEFDANNNPVGWIEYTYEFMLVGDAVRVAVELTNNTSQQHNIGLKMVFDGGFDSVTSPNDGQPIFLPDGTVIRGEQIIRGPFDESNYTWVTYDPSNPLLAVRGTVGLESWQDLRDRGTADEAAGQPTQVEFGLLNNVSAWNFTPNALLPLQDNDWGVGVKWEAVTLPAGRSRRYVTWFGVGSSVASYEYPFAMMAYVPPGLKAEQDPVTGDWHIVDYFGNSPFPVAVYVDNFGTVPLYNASARVRLPSGFELSSGSPSQGLGTVLVNETRSAEWQVIATATRPGRVQFKFTGPLGRYLYAVLDIPTIPVIYPLPATHPAFEMLSFPFVFADKSADHVLASLGSLFPGGPSTIVRYDPREPNAALAYKWYPDPYAATIEPGNGYWVLNDNLLTIVLPDDRAPVSTDNAYTIHVYRGWNQIGNPFTYPVNFLDIVVIDLYGRQWTMEEAVKAGYVLGTLYWWDPYDRVYKWETELDKVVAYPYMGYWLWVQQDAILVVPPPTRVWAAQERRAAAAPEAEQGWRLTLIAEAEGARSEAVQIGEIVGARDGRDERDLFAPPEPTSVPRQRVRLRIVGGDGTAYVTDIRSPRTRRQEWELEVWTNLADRPVTVRWPDLSALPSDLVATLIDEESGRRVYMRTASGYTFRSSAVLKPRRLKIVVGPRSELGPMVTAVQVQAAGRNVEIAYTLAAPGEVTVQVLNIAGRIVKTVASGVLCEAGQNRVVWNGTSDRGTPVPAGRYLVKIVARSVESGRIYHVIRPVAIGR